MVNWKGFSRKRSWPSFKVLSQHQPGETEANHENLNQDILSPGPKFELRTSRIRSRTVNDSTTTFSSRFQLSRSFTIPNEPTKVTFEKNKKRTLTIALFIDALYTSESFKQIVYFNSNASKVLSYSYFWPNVVLTNTHISLKKKMYG
jgi:hypothetical protein